jgi:hypothetical protein
MIEHAAAAGRALTDKYKANLRALVDGWVRNERNATAVLAALGEVTAEAGLGLLGPTPTADLLAHLEQNLRARV